MHESEGAVLLSKKLDKAQNDLKSCSNGQILEILEDLSSEVRLIMSKQGVECYDTLHEIDDLCYDAEIRNNLNYAFEVKKIVDLYEDEVGLPRG